MKNIEEALRQSEERFRHLSENAQEWIWEVDCNGLYTYSSPAVERILGYHPAEIVGQKHFFDFFDSAVKETLTEQTFAIFRKNASLSRFANTAVHRKGHLVFLETSGSPILDRKGKLLGYRGLDIDVTVQKKADIQLQKSEERFRQLAENIDHVFWFMQLDPARMLFISPAFEKIWGETTAELYRNPQLWAEYIHPEDRSRVMELFEACITEADKFVSYDVEYRIVRRDGEIRWIHDYGANYYGQHGKLKTVSGIAEDITERRQAQDALKRMKKELETRVSERTRELARINKQLQAELFERQQVEKALTAKGQELQERSRILEDTNKALEVILASIEKNKDDLEKNVLSNMKLLVLPYLEKLKKPHDSAQRAAYLNELEANLLKLTSPFSQKLSSKFLALTPREVRVAALVREGKTSKEIAVIMNTSKGTIDFHRNHIRMKLGLKNNSGNMRSHLISLE